ncbi:MAG: ABC transporter permease [Ancalomicrobiaceae bacterium]|nr:ABC transporter permease [Ancalomicrobiaceae bacterium]
MTTAHFSPRANAVLAFFSGRLLPVTLVAICVIFALIEPAFLSPENLIGIVHQVSIIGIMAVGMTFVIMTGGIDLSVGPVMAFAGVCAAYTLEASGGNVGLAALAALTLAISIGLFQGLCVAVLGLPSLVVTLAGMSIVRGTALLTGGPDLHLIRGPESFLFIGSGQISGVPFSVFVFAAMIAVAIFLQYRTVFGLTVLAVGDNERAAYLSGRRVRVVKAATYVLCSFGAGVAGIVLASQVHTAASTYGAGIELDVIASVVIGGTSLMGGTGSVPRTVAGVFLIGIMNNGLALMNVPIEMQLIAKGLIIVLALALADRPWQFSR